MRKKSIVKENISPAINCTTPWRLRAIHVLKDYTLGVEFIDGTQGLVEMKQLILSTKAGVFTPLKNEIFFNQVYLSYGVATWPGEIDLAPDAMYDAIKKNGKWVL